MMRHVRSRLQKAVEGAEEPLPWTRMAMRQSMLRSIASNGRHESAAQYFRLGQTLSEGERVTLPCGRAMTRDDCFNEALILHMDQVARICAVAPTRKITLRNGDTMSPLQGRIAALDYGERTAEAYYAIAKCGFGRVTLKDETQLTQADCFAKAFRLGANSADFFLDLANSVRGMYATIAEKRYMKGTLFRKAIAADPTCAKAHVGLGNTLRGKVKTNIHHRRFSKLDCYVEALRLNSKEVEAYRDIGDTLSKLGQEAVTLKDGRTLTAKDCYVEFISHRHSNCPEAYVGLAGVLRDGETATLKDGTILNCVQCCETAIKLGHRSSTAFYLLAEGMTLDQVTQIHETHLPGWLSSDFKGTLKNDGMHHLSKRHCYEIAIRLGNFDVQEHRAKAHCGIGDVQHNMLHYEIAYEKGLRDSRLLLGIGDNLRFNKQFTWGDESLTAMGCFLKVLAAPAGSTSAVVARAYSGLGLRLPVEGNGPRVVALHDGRTLGKLDCYLAALAADARHARAYSGIGRLLADDAATVTLGDGRQLTRRQCFLEALACDPRDRLAICGLADGLAPHETLKLSDGQSLTKLECYRKAAASGPLDAPAYVTLATLVSDHELSDVEVLCRRWEEFRKESARNYFPYKNTVDIDILTLAVECATHPVLANIALGNTNASIARVTPTDEACNLRLTGASRYSFMEAWEHDKACSMVYLGLGDTYWPTPGSQRLKMLDGVLLTKQACYEMAISVDPHNAAAFAGLGRMLKVTGKTTLADGREMTTRDCFLEADALGLRDSVVLCGLGSTLAGATPGEDRVKLRDGAELTRVGCYVEAIAHDAEKVRVRPGCRLDRSCAFLGLADALAAAGETAMLKCGRVVTPRDCYVEVLNMGAFRAMPFKRQYALNALGDLLGAEESVELKPGVVVTKRDCYRLVIEAETNPGDFAREPLNVCRLSMSQAFYSLGLSLREGETVRINSKTNSNDTGDFSSKQCFIAALGYDRTNANAYLALSNLMEETEKVSIVCYAFSKSLCLKLHEALQGHKPVFSVNYDPFAPFFPLNSEERLQDIRDGHGYADEVVRQHCRGS